MTELTAIRRRAGLSQIDVASRLQTSPHLVRMYEKGGRDMIADEAKQEALVNLYAELKAAAGSGR